MRKFFLNLIASLFNTTASASVAGASGWWHYEPEVPKALQKHLE